MPRFQLILAFFLCLNTSFAQQDSLVVHYDTTKLEVKDITESDLETYKNDNDFNYVETVTEESFLSKVKRWLMNMITSFFEAIFGVGKASGILYFVFSILPYLLLALLIFLLIKFFLKVNSRNIISGKQKAASVIITDDENIIKNEDIQELISKAIEQKNYRLAIRYYYLFVLKELSENHLIIWEPQKTNEDYIKELSADGIKRDFKTITRIYDYIWYGEFDIDEMKFETLKPSFETVTKSINTH